MVDRATIIQVFGSLMKKPQYLSESDKYQLTPADFPTSFDQYIFVAIDNLYRGGAQRIYPIDIENYLSTNEVAKQTFLRENGIDFLKDAETLSAEQNFAYYYKKLKKFRLLVELREQGFDISEFYVEAPTSSKELEINRKFEELEISDIVNTLKAQFLQVERAFAQNDTTEVSNIFDGIEKIIENARECVDIGPPLQGSIFNEVCAGARKNMFVVRSGASGISKAIPTDTWLPTPRGWRKAESIRVGGTLFDKEGQPTQVLGVYPQQYRKKNFILHFSDLREASCCIDHLWSYDYLQNGKWHAEVGTVSDIQQHEKVRFPVSKAVQYSKKNFKIEPYIVGAEILPRYKDALLVDDPSKFYLEYLFGSIEQRQALLRGLISKCGTLTKDGYICAQIPNTILSNFYIELGRSLGYIMKNEKNNWISLRARRRDIVDLFAQKTPIDLGVFPLELYVMLGYIEETEDYEEMVCFSVANKDQLFLMNDFVVTHNTRQMVGDACYLSFPFRYDSKLKKWKQEGSDKKSLVIVTEQNKTEIQKMVLAYLTDMNESKLRYGRFDEEEERVIRQALWVLNKYQNHMHIVKMPNPTNELIKAIVRENVLLHDVEYVFFDYIHICPSLLHEFRGAGLRNDEILLFLSTTLKNLAAELEIFVLTSTQVNREANNAKGLRDETSIAGSKAVIDKGDVGLIMSRPSEEELDFLCGNGSPLEEIPNLVSDIYKVRSGEWNQLRIWSYIDMGTLRKVDLFVTDAQLNVVDVGTDFNYQVSTIDFEDAHTLLEIEAVK